MKEATRELPHILTQLKKEASNHQQTLYKGLDKALFGRYSPEQREVIDDLLEQWGSFELDVLLESEEVREGSKLGLYREVQVLSARVYSKAIGYIKQVRSSPSLEHRAVKTYFHENELVFSYNRYFLKRRTFTTKHSYQYAHSDKEPLLGCQEINAALKWMHQQTDNPILARLLQFMVEIGLITLGEEQEVGNRLVVRMERIRREEQRMLYLKSMEVEWWEEAVTLGRREFKSKEQEGSIEEDMRKRLPNYYFYRSEGKKNIEVLHSKFQDYEFLERRHDYIQWMFPNHFGSAFNSNAFPLTYVERELFLADLTIGANLVASIYIYFDFIGVRLNLPTLELSLVDPERLKQAVLVNTHNHLRLMRVLACLSVVGFRRVALGLIGLLDRYTGEELLRRERREFQKSWQIFGDQEGNVAKTMCFLEGDDFPPDHPVIHLLFDLPLQKPREATQQKKQSAQEKLIQPSPTQQEKQEQDHSKLQEEVLVDSENPSLQDKEALKEKGVELVRGVVIEQF